MGKARWIWELDGIGAKTCMTLRTYLFLVNLSDVNASTPCYHQTVNNGHLVEELEGEEMGLFCLLFFMNIKTLSMDFLSLFST